MSCHMRFYRPPPFFIIPGIIFMVMMVKFGFFFVLPLVFFLVVMSGKHRHHHRFTFPEKQKHLEKRKNDAKPIYIRTSDGEWLEVVDSPGDDKPIDTV